MRAEGASEQRTDERTNGLERRTGVLVREVKLVARKKTTRNEKTTNENPLNVTSQKETRQNNSTIVKGKDEWKTIVANRSFERMSKRGNPVVSSLIRNNPVK